MPLVTPQWPPNQPEDLRKNVLQWYQSKGRHQLPWLANADSNGWVNDYYIAVSELMMQQTTVAVGLKRFPLWIATFPTWQSLADASSESVMKAWEGLGYYARARSLHKMAQQVVGEHAGRIPTDRGLRLKLPGVGPTTASALGAFVYGACEPIWDVNVNRVWRRWWDDLYPQLPTKEQKQWEWDMAEQAMPSSPKDIRQWTQAVMDLGATVCTAKDPKCTQCPLSASCRANKNGNQLAFTTNKPKITRQHMWKNWVWIVKDGKVAAVAPKTEGIWAGLWQLPESDVSCAIPDATPPYVQGTHKLSHRDVSWSVVNLPQQSIETEVVWLTAQQWEALALPKPLRAWWNSLGDGRKIWLS